MRSRFEVPMLVNANIGAKPTDYPFGHAQRWLTGAKAALLRSEVRSARRARPPSGAVREILVTFGGSDPRGISAVVAADLRRTAWFRQGGQLTLVLGASYHGPPVRAGRRFEVVQSTADFVARCAAADLVVSGAATTTYELAHLGTPFIPVATVDNQERISMSWARAGVGPGLSTTQRGWRAALCRAVEEAAHDPAASRIAARRVRRLVDGRGVKRLLTALAQPVERGGPRG
jgi:spore coat polysaccharide biosynthesis predicted glycosyltransferase SpsG